jgi:hypothetical protein
MEIRIIGPGVVPHPAIVGGMHVRGRGVPRPIGGPLHWLRSASSWSRGARGPRCRCAGWAVRGNVATADLGSCRWRRLPRRRILPRLRLLAVLRIASLRIALGERQAGSHHGRREDAAGDP